ncbi:MAG: hypothetical protein R3D70_10790 [Rhizobiaceae bacterium]
MSSDTQANWAPPRATPHNLAPEHLADWRKTTDELRTLAIGEGLSRSGNKSPRRRSPWDVIALV